MVVTATRHSIPISNFTRRQQLSLPPTDPRQQHTQSAPAANPKRVPTSVNRRLVRVRRFGISPTSFAAPEPFVWLPSSLETGGKSPLTMVMALAPGARLCHGHQPETFSASSRFGNGVALKTRCTPSLGGARPKHSLVVSSVLGGGQKSEDIGSSDEQKKAGLFRNIEGLYETVQEQKQEFYTVGDFMTPVSELLVAKKSTTVDEALEALVDNRITGMPVVDDDGKLIGVVSDYDLLALDSISGKPPAEMGLFPEPGRTWKAFKEIQKLLIKTHGKTVGEVMTPSPLVVREMTNLEDAARLLLDSKYRRLPVVDDGGKLVGLLTRGNVVRAALQMKRAAVKVYKESRP